MAIYPNDHHPAHVHVMGNGLEAVFILNCPTGPVGLRENYGFSRPETSRIEGMLQENVAGLCAAWERIHGSR